MAIPRSSNCSYCHLNAKKAQSVHDVHKRIMGRICEQCHPNIRTSRQAVFGNPLVNKYLKEKEPKAQEKPPSFLVSEMLRYFDEISKNILALFIQVR